MCNVLWDIIKCPGKVICCCCECALNMLLCGICSFVIILVVIGLIVYFTVYYHKDTGGSHEGKEMADRIIREVPQTFRDYFKSLN